MASEIYRVIDLVRVDTFALACMIPIPQRTTYFGATWLPFSNLVIEKPTVPHCKMAFSTMIVITFRFG